MARRNEGIEVRHAASCATTNARRCSCDPKYRAAVYVAQERRYVKRTFPTIELAKAWRSDAQREARQGALKVAKPITLRAYAEQYVTDARAGMRIARKGRGSEAVAYKPSSIRTLDEALRLRILPELGARRMADIRSADVRRMVQRWDAQGLSASVIRNTHHALRAVYRRALEDEIVHHDPTDRVPLPRLPEGRDRIATAGEAERLLATLATGTERALWALAMYAGLRRGEILALRWHDVDLAEGTISVERSFDPGDYDAQHGRDGMVDPKSRSGRRTVPIVARLRPLLAAHQLATADTTGNTLVFARPNDEARPLLETTVRNRANAAWTEAKLATIGLHECRHTFASLMIAAGVNVKALSVLMGHSSVAFTLDRYGHLLPGAEHEAAALLDTYLDAQTGTA